MLLSTISPAPSATARQGPRDSVEAGGLASAVRKNLPAIRRDPFGVDGNDDALAAESRAARMRTGWASAEELMLILSAPA